MQFYAKTFTLLRHYAKASKMPFPVLHAYLYALFISAFFVLFLRKCRMKFSLRLCFDLVVTGSWKPSRAYTPPWVRISPLPPSIKRTPCIYRGFLHFQLGEYLKKAAILAAFHIQSVLHFYCCSTSFRFSAFKPTFNAPSSGATKRPFLFRM